MDAVSGDGRTGREGLLSTLNDRMSDSESGIGAPLALKGELGPARPRLIVTIDMNVSGSLDGDTQCNSHGRLAVVPFGLPGQGQVWEDRRGKSCRNDVSIYLRIVVVSGD